MLFAGDMSDKSLCLDVMVADRTNPDHQWRGATIRGFYNAKGAYSAENRRIQEVAHMPWLVWAGTDVPVAVAALHTDERPFVTVFTNRPRPIQELARYRREPRIELAGGFMLASEVMLYDHEASSLPTAVSRAVGETVADQLFVVQAVDTGSLAILTAQLTMGEPMPMIRDGVQPTTQVEAQRELVRV